MNQQPDKLFREKLERFNKPISANAWKRIESGLEKKIRKGLLLKVAASIVLLAAAGVFLWPQGTPEVHQKIAQKNTEKKIKTPSMKKNLSPAIERASPEHEPGEVTNVPSNSKAINKSQKKIKSPTGEDTIPAKIVVADLQQEKITSILPESNLAEPAPLIAEMVVQNTAAKDAGVHIIYTAEEVNEKYLDKKSLAEATTGEKKPSTLKKLLDKAYDMKYNQDPFGDLRQKKNEILALNFKNEKQRSQNK